VRRMIERMRLIGLETIFPPDLRRAEAEDGSGKGTGCLAAAASAGRAFASLDNPVREKLRLDLLNIGREDHIR